MAGRRWRDTQELWHHITPLRLWNMVQVLASYYLSKMLKRPIQWGFPISISIEPTTSCNLRCPECPSGLRSFSRPTGMLDPVFFQKLLRELSPRLTFLTFYFQGEPYLNQRFLEMVSEAQKAGLYTVTSTNGHYLTDAMCEATIKSGLSRLIVSLDGTTQETYAAYRVGGSLEKVVEGVKRLVAARKRLSSKRPYIVFQFLVVKPNEHQIQEAQKLALDLEVDDIWFKTAQIYGYEKGSPLIPDNPIYSRYALQEDGSYRFKGKLENHCWKLWHAPVITWDGTVVPCCFDKDAHHPMGTLQESPFAEIWKGPAYAKFRSSVLRSRKETDICTNCSEGTKVWA